MTRTVQDVMTKTVVVVHDTAGFKEIAGLMDTYRVSAVPVVDKDGRLVGIVSEGDLLLKEEFADESGRAPLFEGGRRRRDRTKAEGLVAAQLMTSPVLTVSPSATLAQAARLMHRNGVKRLPVVGVDGHVAGIVSRADLLKVFLRPDEDIRGDIDIVMDRTLMIDREGIRVGVADGLVTLDGQVERASLVPVLTGLVRGVDGVVGVEDHLTYEVDDITRQPGTLTPWGVYEPSLRSRS
jgi:CBS-domain-containing membrane protein